MALSLPRPTVPRFRLVLLLAALLATLYWRLAVEPDDAVASVAFVEPLVAPMPQAAPDARDERAPLRLGPAQRDPFATPAPPPAPAPTVTQTAAPPPAAPPLPYRFFGQTQDPSGKPVIFVERDGRLFAIAKGELIEDQYRVESVEPGKLTFYLRQRRA